MLVKIEKYKFANARSKNNSGEALIIDENSNYRKLNNLKSNQTVK